MGSTWPEPIDRRSFATSTPKANGFQKGRRGQCVFVGSRKTIWGRCADANGKVRPAALCDDADAAEAMLAAMKQRAKREARDDIDPFEDHRSRPPESRAATCSAFDHRADDRSLLARRLARHEHGVGVAPEHRRACPANDASDWHGRRYGFCLHKWLHTPCRNQPF